MPIYEAIERGYDGSQVREPGDVFSFKGKPGRWMRPASVKANPKADGQHVCEVCGFDAANAFGLQAHMRSHKKVDQDKEEVIDPDPEKEDP